MNMDPLLTAHVNALRSNKYPGRGIVIGMTPSGQHLVQVYWTMGRSVNSRNRVFELDGDSVRNRAFDESKMTDPSLIIYYPLKKAEGIHIVSNGDQTDTIWDGIRHNRAFEHSLETRAYEPDPPHFTPRISGIIDTSATGYKLSILKSSRNRPEVCIRNFYHYSAFTAGEGHCIHTYGEERDGTLLSFAGEP